MTNYSIFFLFQNRELKDANLLCRQRAVVALCEHLHDPEHIAEALRCGWYMYNLLLCKLMLHVYITVLIKIKGKISLVGQKFCNIRNTCEKFGKN